MSVTKRLTGENIDLDDERELDAFDDQAIAAGMERIRAEGEELRRRGILDSNGNLLMRNSPLTCGKTLTAILAVNRAHK